MLWSADNADEAELLTDILLVLGLRVSADIELLYARRKLAHHLLARKGEAPVLGDTRVRGPPRLYRENIRTRPVRTRSTLQIDGCTDSREARRCNMRELAESLNDAHFACRYRRAAEAHLVEFCII